MVTISHAVFIAFYNIFSFCSHKNPGLGNKRMQWGVEPGFNLKCSDSRAISFNHYTVLLLNCRWNVVFHFLHFHFFNYEFFPPYVYMFCFFFFPLKIAFHVFRHLLLGCWSFILTVWNFMYWGNQPFVNYVTDIFPQVFI